MYCKSCGKVLEGDPRFCMNCGAELYPPNNGRSNPNIDKSYLALWAVMGALIVGLFWVATRNSEGGFKDQVQHGLMNYAV